MDSLSCCAYPLCTWLQGQFQNAYPELMRLSSYRIAKAVEAPDGTCSVAVDVTSGPEVGAKHVEHVCMKLACLRV